MSASRVALAVSAGVLAVSSAWAPGVAAGAPQSPTAEATIAFTSVRSGRRAIWRLGPRAGAVRLTAPPAVVRRCGCRSGEFDSHPAWSADGRRIAFTRGARLHIVAADGTGLRRVPAPPGAEDFEPAWSARGRLAFVRQRPARRGSGYVHELVSVDARGRSPHVLAGPSRFAYRSFAWSNDGSRIAFAVPYLDPGFTVGLFVKRVPAGRARFVLRAVGIGELDWSPDDSTLVAATSVPGALPFDPYRLFAIRLADRRIVQLTRVPSSKTGDGAPRWSPSGELIAFTRTTPRSDAVHVVRPSGRGERLLAADARGAAWSPDGRTLAIVHGVSGRGRPLTLSTVAVETGARRPRVRLIRPADADGLGDQAWRPSG